MSYLIYMATNRVNGKRYIGVTSRKLAVRKRQHIRLARIGERGCPRLYDALRKYGSESFEWSVIGTERTHAAAYRLEAEKIKKLAPEYNVSDGGLGSTNVIAWNRIRVICLEDGVIYSSMEDAGKAYGLKSADICNVCKGKQRTAGNGRHFIKYKKPMSEPQRMALIKRLDMKAAKERRRLQRARIDQCKSVRNGRDRLGRSAAGPMSNARSVICLNDGRKFNSASAAARKYDVDKGALVQVCLGNRGRKTIGGLRFAYLEAA